MTHGDKAKAKAAKSNKASVKKAGSQGGENGKSKAAGQGSKAVQSGKTSQSGKAGEGVKAGAEKAAAAKKGSSPAPAPIPAKDSGADARAKVRTPADNGGNAGGFSNPVIAGAFKRALKKYPNALRKLTD